MRHTLFLSSLALGLLAAIAQPAKAQDRPPVKSPVPTRPSPPTRPQDPTKPVESSKPPVEVVPPPKLVQLSPPMSAEAIAAALAKKVDLELAAVPLSQAIDAIKSQSNLEFRPISDAPTKRSSDKGASATVTAHLKGVSVASALDLVLRDTGLTWSIDRGAVLIAPPDQHPATIEVYNIRDLLPGHSGAEGSDDQSDLQYDPIFTLITGIIQCPAWSADVATIQDCNPFHGTFTVHQDQRTQAKVAGLLAALRKARDLKPTQFDASVNRGFATTGPDDAAVVAALAANVEVAFKDAKLDDVVEWIRSKCGIPVYLDPGALAAMPDKQTFTLRANGVPLKTLLDELLPQGKLTYVVQDETLLIVPQEAGADMRSTRVYPVGDLISGDADHDDLDDQYAQLLDAITRNVAPDSWATLDRQKSTGAYAAYLPAGRAVVCDQTRAAHDEIAATLAKMRRAVAAQPIVDVKPAAADEPAKTRPLAMKIYKLNQDLPADDFAQVVRDLIEPKRWTGEAYIHGVPGAIVVKQTPAIQKRVEKLLFDLGAIPDPKKAAASGTPSLISTRKGA